MSFHLIGPKDGMFVKSHEFLSFAKNMPNIFVKSKR